MLNPFERSFARWQCHRHTGLTVIATLAAVLLVVVVGKVSRGFCCAMHTPIKPEHPPAS